MTKQQFLESELRPGESLLWSEEPDALAFLTGEKIFGLLFAFGWLTFAVLMSWSGEDKLGPMFMLPIGVFIAGASIWDAFQAHFTLYGITTSRLLIVRLYPWKQEVESYSERDIRFLRKTRSKFAGGSLTFTTISSTGSKGRVRHSPVGFFGVDNVDFVEALIEKHFRYRDFNTHSTKSNCDVSL